MRSAGSCASRLQYAHAGSRAIEPGVTCEAVIAAQDLGILHELRNMIPMACRLVVYHKSGNESNLDKCAVELPDNSVCLPRRNVGREYETYISHVVEHYHELPDWLIFFPAVLNRHDRQHLLSAMMNATLFSGEPRSPEAFHCVRRMRDCEGFFAKPLQNVSQYSQFTMRDYNGLHPTRVSFETMGDLIRDGVGAVRGAVMSLKDPQSEHWRNVQPGMINHTLVEQEATQACGRACVTGVCHYGLFTTTRENLRDQPLAVYEALLQEFQSLNPEAGFMLEVMSEIVFGRLHSRKLHPGGHCAADCTQVCPNSLHRDGRLDCESDPQGADPHGPVQDWLWTRNTPPADANKQPSLELKGSWWWWFAHPSVTKLH